MDVVAAHELLDGVDPLESKVAPAQHLPHGVVGEDVVQLVRLEGVEGLGIAAGQLQDVEAVVSRQVHGATLLRCA